MFHYALERDILFLPEIIDKKRRERTANMRNRIHVFSMDIRLKFVVFSYRPKTCLNASDKHLFLLNCCC